MLTTDVRFEGWTVESWERLIELWRPAARAESRKRGGLLVIHEDRTALKMLHTGHGRLDPPAWPVPLATLAAEHGASWVLAAHADAFGEVMERFGSRARRTDDVLDQSLTIAQAVREMIVDGSIATWPRRLRGIPVPTAAMVRRALSATCADGKCMALGAFEEGDLWTALVARRRGAGFDVIAGPYELRAATGLLSGDWRRDHRYLVEAIQDAYGELSLGLFGPRSDLRALVTSSEPGAWGRAAVLRDVVLSPMPPSIGIAVGVDGARYAFEGLRALTSRVGVLGVLDPTLQRGRRALGRIAGGRDLSAILGFDPLDALRRLLQRE